MFLADRFNPLQPVHHVFRSPISVFKSSAVSADAPAFGIEPWRQWTDPGLCGMGRCKSISYLGECRMVDLKQLDGTRCRGRTAKRAVPDGFEKNRSIHPPPASYKLG